MLTEKNELVSLMIHEIEHAFGRKVVSSRDCIELSVEVYNKTEQQLNPNTLRRFFSLVKAEYSPSQSTLNILSRYCGFISAEDLYKIKTAETFGEEEIKKETMLQYFSNIFRDSPVKNNHDHTLLSMTLQTIKFLNANKFLTDKFQSLIAKTPNGIHYYFEKLVNVDKLNSFYGNGLRFYLKEKATVDAQIFTASIYTMKYWLSDEKEKLIKSIDVLLTNSPSNIKMHPYLKARYFSALLFYYHATESNAEPVKAEINRCFQHLISDPDLSKYLYYYIFIVSFALLLTGHAKEAIYYIDQSKTKVKVHDETRIFSYTESYATIEAFGLCKLGFLDEAKAKLSEINSDTYPFLIKKLMSIIHLSVKLKLEPKNDKKYNESRLNTLIYETGFKKLSKIF